MTYQERVQKIAEDLARIITNQMDTVDGYGGFDSLPESTKLQAIDRMRECARYCLQQKAEGFEEGYTRAALDAFATYNGEEVKNIEAHMIFNGLKPIQ